MSYELGHSPGGGGRGGRGGRAGAARGSRVARGGRSYAVNTRAAGTATAARARRVADGVSGYGNLAGYEGGLGFSLTSLIQPAISFLPGGNFVNAGINAVSSASAPGSVQYTAQWQVGLPGPGDIKDQTRIAYAKRDHDLAMSGDATAYTNLKNQAVGSATAVGKAWYNAALRDVNNSRATTGAPVTGAPVVSVPTAPNVDVSAPQLVRADVAGVGGANPLLLIGIALAVVMAIRGR